MRKNEMKKRWVSLFVENQIGVLAKISGLLAGKSYNVDSLTVGTTEDPTVSRMTIGMTCDDMTFEQIKKQLNRSIEVIKVLDFTDKPIHKKEIMYIKVIGCSDKDKDEIFRIASAFGLDVVDYGKKQVLVECVLTETRNDDLVELFSKSFPSRIEIVRGGSVAVEAISTAEQ